MLPVPVSDISRVMGLKKGVGDVEHLMQAIERGLPKQALSAVLAGAAGNELNVTASTGSGARNVDLSGHLALRGSGAALDPACAFESSFDAVTNRTMQIGLTDRIIRDGLLTLSTSTGSATVEFDASGNARVDLGVGSPQTYPINIVRNFCVF